jgi:hypothetical protein
MHESHTSLHELAMMHICTKKKLLTFGASPWSWSNHLKHCTAIYWCGRKPQHLHTKEAAATDGENPSRGTHIYIGPWCGPTSPHEQPSCAMLVGPTVVIAYMCGTVDDCFAPSIQVWYVPSLRSQNNPYVISNESINLSLILSPGKNTILIFQKVRLNFD